MLYFRSLLFAILVFYANTTLAQNYDSIPDFITDRPDQTESAYAVPKNYLQIETGSQYEKTDIFGIKVRDYTYNTTLIRYGLFNKFELRLGINLLDLESNGFAPGTDPSLDFSPLLFGAKYEMVKENGWIPNIAVFGHAYIPLGTTYDSGELESEIRIAFANTLSERSGLSYNLGIEFLGGDPVYFYTLAYSYSFTEKFALYAELYADIYDTDIDQYWNAGFTYLLSRNVQLDGYAGTGINTNQDLLLGVGVSFRLPN